MAQELISAPNDDPAFLLRRVKIQLFGPISVQLPSAISKPCRSLLGGDISLRFGHQLVTKPAMLVLRWNRTPVSTHPTRNFLTVALLNNGG